MTSGPGVAALTIERSNDEEVRLHLRGRLDAQTTGSLWRESHRELAQPPARLVIDAAALTYCDAAGFALLLDLQRRQHAAASDFELRNLPAALNSVLDLFQPEELARPCAQPRPVPLAESVGRGTVSVLQDLRRQIAFVGELAAALARVPFQLRKLRWRDVWLAAETAAVDALPIVALIAFLMGLILAFQAAVALHAYGADLFVADLVSLALLRELAPLMTAVVLAGRTGASFAAEIGTMKVNEEVDAVVTMGLEPMQFLVVPRVLALVVLTPLLAVFADLCGLIGGLVVYTVSLGFPVVTYINQASNFVDMSDFLGGLSKAFVFGILIAGIGCLRGLETGKGASAVGLSATRAVVAGIFLIVVADGLFAILFYALGI